MLAAPMGDDQLGPRRSNGDAAIKRFDALAQRLDKNSKTALVNAAGSRIGPS
jgi:hypothetical protein